MHNLSLTDLTEQQRLTWYSTDSDVKMCLVKGTPEENCQNYIRILVKTDANTLLVCATNAFKPMCRDYGVHAGNYTILKEKGGQAMCPYDPRHNSTFVYVDGELYTGTVADFAGMDPIIYREPLQTEQYDSKSLNGEYLSLSFFPSDLIRDSRKAFEKLKKEKGKEKKMMIIIGGVAMKWRMTLTRD